MISELDSKIFHFICTSSFYDGSEGIFPAELAMSKFSLKHGVFATMQIRINPGILPLTAAHLAREKSDKTHKYPLPPNCLGEEDYLNILTEMIKFLHPFEKFPILFSEGNFREGKQTLTETNKIVQKIFYESQAPNLFGNLKIYPIDELFFVIQRTTVTNENIQNETSKASFPSVPYASNVFQSHSHNFESAECCDFHYEEDARNHCCLSKVFQYGYMFDEWCGNKNRYERIEGQHYPKNFEP